MDKPAQEKVAALLFQWEELKQSGEPVTPESLCQDSPEILEELKRQIKVLSRVNELLNLVPKETPGGRDLETQFDKQALGKRGASSTQKSSAVADFPRIANYQIVEEIGHGGMGVVFKAYDPELDWLVAIKRLNRSESSNNQHYLERFKREGKVLAKLSHDNIVKIHLAGVHDGQHYFVMRYYPKGPLSKQLKRFSSPADIAKLMAQVARAVHCAHEQNILHRDLKPSNILLDEHDRPIVSDFGLAKTASEVVAEALPSLAEESTIDYQQALTAAGARIGTPPYMAPEQFYVGTITKSSDIWSLGIILYELAVGTRPFQASKLAELAKEVNTGLVAEPRKVNPAIPSSLNKIIIQCLQTDPDLRYKNAALLADDLEATLRGKTRRWVLAAGGLALLGGGVEMGRRIKAKREEDRLDEEFVNDCIKLRDDLHKTGRVELLTEDGSPKAYRWKTGDPSRKIKTAQGAYFSSTTTDIVDTLDSIASDHFGIDLAITMNCKIQRDGNCGMYLFRNKLDDDEFIMISSLVSYNKLKSRLVPSLNIEVYSRQRSESSTLQLISHTIYIHKEENSNKAKIDMSITCVNERILYYVENKLVCNIGKNDIESRLADASYDKIWNERYSRIKHQGLALTAPSTGAIGLTAYSQPCTIRQQTVYVN